MSCPYYGSLLRQDGTVYGTSSLWCTPWGSIMIFINHINGVLTPPGNITTALNAINAAVIFNLFKLESIHFYKRNWMSSSRTLSVSPFFCTQQCGFHRVGQSDNLFSPKQRVGIGGCAWELCKPTSLSVCVSLSIIHAFLLPEISIAMVPSSILRGSEYLAKIAHHRTLLHRWTLHWQTLLWQPANLYSSSPTIQKLMLNLWLTTFLAHLVNQSLVYDRQMIPLEIAIGFTHEVGAWTYLKPTWPSLSGSVLFEQGKY